MAEVGDWMNSKILKLDDDKFEFIIIHTKLSPHPHHLSITIKNTIFTPATHVKNLGVIQDSCLTMEKQVNTILRSCYCNIRTIGKIRRYITTDACKTLVQAMVTSRLDYANILLDGLPQSLLGRMQRLQNTAARLITRTPRRNHITPVLIDLHWLPVEYRPRYKVLLYTYKALNGLAPAYLRDLLEQYHPTRSLRSASKLLLKVPSQRTVTYGSRSFRMSAAVQWNSLPNHLKHASSIGTFKKLLKTYLFKLAYSL